MVLYILKKKKHFNISNTLENFISKEISALAKYSGDSGSCEQQTASTLASQGPRWHWPSLITPLPEVQQELAARSPACCIYNPQQQT